MDCILCKSEKVLIIETHPIEDLIALWQFTDITEELKVDKLIVYQCKHCSLKFFDPKLAGGDKFYSELSKLDWYYLHAGKTEYDYVQKYMKNGLKVLDVGAGIGVLSTKIKVNLDYTGLELSTRAVEIAQKNNINIKQEDLIIHAKNNHEKYDVVCLFQVLEHLSELDNFLKSITLTLKSKGYFIIAVPNNEGFISRHPNYVFNLPPHHTILWTESSLKFLSKKYNFDIVDIEVELLQDIHAVYAHRAYLMNLFKNIFGLPNLLIDKSLMHKVVYRLVCKLLNVKYIEKLILPYARKNEKYGQSIIIALQKK
jgi:SAM-dependent methyltransferase